MMINERSEDRGGKQKFKCKACAIGFLTVKQYEKHRKTSSHKAIEKLKKEAEAEGKKSNLYLMSSVLEG